MWASALLEPSKEQLSTQRSEKAPKCSVILCWEVGHTGAVESLRNWKPPFLLAGTPARLLTCSPAREILSQWCHSPAPNPRFSRILFITRIFFLFYPPQGNSSTQRQVLWCSAVSYWLRCPLPILESWVEHQLTSIFLKFFVLIFFYYFLQYICVAIGNPSLLLFFISVLFVPSHHFSFYLSSLTFWYLSVSWYNEYRQR